MMESHDWLWPIVKFHEGFGPYLLDQIWICIDTVLMSEHTCTLVECGSADDIVLAPVLPF